MDYNLSGMLQNGDFLAAIRGIAPQNQRQLKACKGLRRHLASGLVG
jgi:hypothetical protein